MCRTSIKNVLSTVPIFINEIVPSHRGKKFWLDKTGFTCHLSVEFCHQSMKWISYQDNSSFINTFLNLKIRFYESKVLSNNLWRIPWMCAICGFLLQWQNPPCMKYLRLAILHLSIYLMTLHSPSKFLKWSVQMTKPSSWMPTCAHVK